ncbi:MAG: helicase-related protein [Caldilineaceae bacterium]
MTEFLPGTEVLARGLRWQVVFSQNLGVQTLYRLRGLQGVVSGQEFDLLAPFEALQPITQQLRTEDASPLRNWTVYHQAFLIEQTSGANALLSVQPGRLRLEPYQLVPVLRAIRMSRPRLLLADSVGLGKTIQAGLILTELIARRLTHRILVVSPAGPLLEQWKSEMNERFGLRLVEVNRAKLEEVRRSTELGANPFDHLPLAIASIDFLKQESVLEQLERSSYDAIVIDEAHHCMDLGTIGEREDSQRRRLAETLARQCDALLLLTATPHDGHDRSFASLCELLDPSLVDGRGELRGTRYTNHVIRRLKRHILDPQNPKQSIFKERVVRPIRVQVDETQSGAYADLQHTLLNLIAPELRRAFKSRRYSDVLTYITILKRSVSSVLACRNTLTQVAERIQSLVNNQAESQESKRQRLRTLRDYQRKLDRFGVIGFAEETEFAQLEVEELAQQLVELQREVQRGSGTLKQTTNILATLDELVGLANAALEQDPKLLRLTELVYEIRNHEPTANILIYTEYVDSQAAAAARLRKAQAGEILTINGEDNETLRKELTERFQRQEQLILISTDTAAEGLNLQARCHHLIHLELPFNPNRLEQRNGRIDRYGQQYEPIIHYLYLGDTFEERILLRLIAKFERQRRILTFVPNTLGLTTATDADTQRLLAGLLEEDNRLFQSEGTLFDFTSDEPEVGAEGAVRDILEEIDRSLSGYRQAAKANSWLGEGGLNAEANQVVEALQANQRGTHFTASELARFIINAVKLDGGDVQGSVEESIFALRLPPVWRYGLDDLPGWQPGVDRILLTSRLEVTRDRQGNTVGFLGRAHPLVRRALDRVRSLGLGQSNSSQLDVRVSAAKAKVKEPSLLCTFLGRVGSQAGRELEMVLAVRIAASGDAQFYLNAGDWLPLTNPGNAINPSGLWKRSFANWGEAGQELALEVAEAEFKTVAAFFANSHRTMLEREAAALDQWLQQRTTEIIGDNRVEAAVQVSLFVTSNGEAAPVQPAWRTMNMPGERLAAFAQDGYQSAAKRSEANGVLRLHQQRLTQLQARLDLGAPEVTQLGLLMLVAE